MRLIVIAAVSATALLTACSSTRRCESEQPYQKAETLQTPGAVPGLTVPESPSALRIPPAPANSVAFGQKVDDPKEPGKTKYECLDMPPRLSLPPEPPPAATPAPAKS
ncbi:MAG: hypothetical protein ACREVL_05515 [Solimonas sp.]